MSLIDHHLQNGGSPSISGDFPEVKQSPTFLSNQDSGINFPDILQTHQDHQKLIHGGPAIKQQKMSPTDLSGKLNFLCNEKLKSRTLNVRDLVCTKTSWVCSLHLRIFLHFFSTQSLFSFSITYTEKRWWVFQQKINKQHLISIKLLQKRIFLYSHLS